MKCLDEGTLQAYLDSELAEAQMRDAAAHLEACTSCRENLGRAAATLGRVSAWLDALAPEDVAAVQGGTQRFAGSPAGGGLWWAAAAVAGLLAASLVLFLVVQRQPRAPVLWVKKEAEAVPVVVLTPKAVPARLAAQKRVRVTRPKPAPPLNGFVPFDNADPMQVGMVVRVMLPVSDAQLIAADLVIGEDGRARAIRFVR